MQASEQAGPFSSDASAALGVFDGISSPEEFDAAKRFYELFEFYPARLQASRMAARILERFDTIGLAGLDPASNQGSQAPLSAVIYAAFDFGKLTTFAEIEDALPGYNQVDPSTREMFYFYFGLSQIANGSLADARSKFLILLAQDSGSHVAALGALHLAETYLLEGQYLQAAIHYMDARDSYLIYPDVSETADKSLMALINTDAVNQDEALLAYAELKTNRETAMMAPKN